MSTELTEVMITSRHRQLKRAVEQAKRELEAFRIEHNLHKPSAWSATRRLKIKRAFLDKLAKKAADHINQSKIHADLGQAAHAEHHRAKAQEAVYEMTRQRKLIDKLEIEAAAEAKL